MASGTGEKTEHPTEKRLRESRRKGQVSKSQDLTSAVLLLAAVAVLALAGRHVGGALGALMADSLAHGAAFKGELDQTAALAALFKGVTAMAWALAPLFLALFTLAFLVNYLQVGSIFAIETMKPDMNKLNPVEGFKSKFLKPRPYIELAKTIVKIVITTFVIYSVLMKSRQDIVGLTRQQVPAVVFFVSGLVAEIGLKVGLAFLAIGAYTSAGVSLGLGLSMWLALPLAGLAAAAVGLVTGLPCLRLKGIYLALPTFALHFVVLFLAKQIELSAG